MKTKLLVSALFLAACGSTTGPDLGEEFELRVGERVPLSSADVSIRFIQVTEDSRCPTGGQCVWAGDAAVLLEIAPLVGDAYEVTLHTFLEPKAVSLGRIELLLVRLDPYPETPGSILPHEYVTTLTTRSTSDESS